MSGLIEKDLRLILQKKSNFIIFIAVGSILACTTDNHFVTAYMMMIFAILGIGTISYDEFDNGYPFLLTLPFTRVTYVLEKYVFCIFSGIFGFVISNLIIIAIQLITKNVFPIEAILESFLYLPVILIMVSFILPVQLKFGAEKARIGLLLVSGGFISLLYLVNRFLPDTAALFQTIAEMKSSTVTGILYLISFVFVGISYLISTSIMKHKEF